MLQVTPLLRNILDSDVISPFVIVEIGFSSALGGPIRITDLPRDITYDGNVYYANGGLADVSPPKTEGEVARYLFNITVTDSDFTYREIFSQESTGVTVEILAGFVNNLTGQPYSDYLPIHYGKITNTSFSIESDSPLVSIQCAGPFVKLQQITNRVTTAASQKFYHPGDTSMDYSYDTKNEDILKWGGLG